MHPDTSDGDLLDLARTGDDRAYAELWSRHARAATRLASQFRGTWEAEDLVAEAYTRVLDLIRRGRGPTEAFRPYLFAVVRNVAQAWSKKMDLPVDDLDALPAPGTETDPAIRSLESRLTRRAFEALPERQRTVLWYTEVEGMAPQEIAQLVGMTPNSVSALAYRAREALRTEWIQAHLQHAAASGDCEWTLSRLGDYTRDHLTARNRQRADGHLANCASCQRARQELKDVGSSLAIAILAPVVGLGAGIGYLAGSGATPAVAAAAPLAPGLLATAAVPATLGGVGGGLLSGAAVIAIAAAVVVGAVPAGTPSEAFEPRPTTVAEVPMSAGAKPQPDPVPQPAVDPAIPADSASAELPPPPAAPPPAAPPPAAPPPPSFSASIAEDSVRPSYAGTGEPGATVRLADAGGAPLAETIVQPDGSWYIAPLMSLSPATNGFRATQTGASGLTSEPTVLGPYQFRLQPTYPQASQPCGWASYGVRGWEGATLGVRIETPTTDTVENVSLNEGGYRQAAGELTEPWRYTFFYADNPSAPAIVYSGCGW